MDRRGRGRLGELGGRDVRGTGRVAVYVVRIMSETAAHIITYTYVHAHAHAHAHAHVRLVLASQNLNLDCSLSSIALGRCNTEKRGDENAFVHGAHSFISCDAYMYMYRARVPW